ncbi:MAG TPA: ABC transporter permease [Ignavibacteriaceae bacterium]|nr:ABC transporter permease [Ignavibacteriaceae bacterium]
MRTKNLFKAAIISIAKNKMRSLLTMLGIIIGVGAVLVMVAIGQGAQSQIESQINSLGTNLVIIYPGAARTSGVSMGAGSFTRLTLEDVDLVKKNAVTVSGVSPVIRTGAQLIGGSGNWNTGVYGVSPDYLEIRAWNLASGDFFSETDVRAQNKVCVIGQTILKNLFADQDPVGQQLRIRNVPFKIIGVLTEKGQNANGQDQDDVVLAPYTTVQYRLSGFRFIGQILCSALTAKTIPQTEEELSSLMRQSHKIQPGEDDDFTIRNQTDIAEAAQSTTDVLTTLLASIAGISLIVGGIGIMNIMLVSVTERTREIGIRMAIGARGSDILTQFLVEATLLSLGGGIIGIIIGIVATKLVNDLYGWYTSLSVLTMLISFGFSGLVGIFFGFYPARKAAALNPIDALHFE